MIVGRDISSRLFVMTGVSSWSQSSIEGLLFRNIAQIDFLLLGNGELSLKLHVEFVEFFDSGLKFQILCIEIFSIMS